MNVLPAQTYKFFYSLGCRRSVIKIIVESLRLDSTYLEIFLSEMLFGRVTKVN